MGRLCQIPVKIPPFMIFRCFPPMIATGTLQGGTDREGVNDGQCRALAHSEPLAHHPHSGAQMEPGCQAGPETTLISLTLGQTPIATGEAPCRPRPLQQLEGAISDLNENNLRTCTYVQWRSKSHLLRLLLDD